MPQILIEIPPGLRPACGGVEQARVDAEDVGAALEGLARAYPAVRASLMTREGHLKSSFLLYVDDQDVRNLERERTRLRADARLTLVSALPGG